MEERGRNRIEQREKSELPMSEQRLQLTSWETLQSCSELGQEDQVDQSLYVGCLKKTAGKEIPKEGLQLEVIC